MMSGDSTQSRKRLIGLTAAAVALTLLTGAAYGWWTQRWGAPPDLKAAGDRVVLLPQQLGPWRQVKERKLPPGVLEILKCAGYASRVYVNEQTNDELTVALLVGPAGPMSVHTPEVCFPSQAYELATVRERCLFRPPGGDVHSLWATQFKGKDAGAGLVQVYYGWSDGGPWQASQWPRFEYGGVPLLFKMEVAGPIASTLTEDSSDPCQSFIDAFLTNYWQVDGAGETTNMEPAH